MAEGVPDIVLALGLAGFVLIVMLLALLARRRTPASTDAKLDALDRRLGAAEQKWADALDRRLGAAEQKWADTDHDVRGIKMIVGNLPTKENINAIAVQVAESRGKMEGVQATLHSQTKSLDRIEDFLMKTSADAIVAGNKANSGEKA